MLGMTLSTRDFAYPTAIRNDSFRRILNCVFQPTFNSVLRVLGGRRIQIRSKNIIKRLHARPKISTSPRFRESVRGGLRNAQDFGDWRFDQIQVVERRDSRARNLIG